MARRNSDFLEKTSLKCGCIYTLNLDIIENNISEDYIKLCTTHYNPKVHKQEFKLNKHTNIYESIVNKQKKNKKQRSNSISYDNVCDDRIVTFGKYKYKSFDYVYNTDKTYCYNLSFWKNANQTPNHNLNEFISFVRNAITTF